MTTGSASKSGARFEQRLKGVEVRPSSIRIAYQQNGRRVRKTLSLEPTPENVLAAAEMRKKYAEAAKRGDTWVLGDIEQPDLISLKEYCAEMFRSARRRATKHSIPYELSSADEDDLMRDAGGACSLTGVCFSLERGSHQRRPFAPSLDRIDSSIGYTAKNCRVVCVAANYALNEWGENVFALVAKGYVKNRVL